MPTSPLFILKYAVPGLLYAICNVLNYVVVSMVGSTNYQLLNNMKIVTTAVIYRLTLGKEIKLIQWLAILLLTLAMCIAALQNCPKQNNSSHSPIASNGTVGTEHEAGDQMAAGITTMIFVSCLSSMAGVYNEKLVKGTKANVWYQNVLLYVWTFLFCIVDLSSWFSGGGSKPTTTTSTLSSSSATGSFGLNLSGTNGIFHGFSMILWSVILMKAFYGQVVSLVFKYADNILKVYASSVSVFVSAIACYLFLGIPLTGATMAAGGLVVIATMLYYNYNALLQTDSELCTSMCSSTPAGYHEVKTSEDSELGESI